MVDAHVHLREPGATHKEDILSGTAAALAGGVVAVLDMPNNRPSTVNDAALSSKEAGFAATAVCDYGLFLGYGGGDLGPLGDCASRAVGLKLYLDETYGDLRVERADLASLFAAWPGPGPIALHAESPSILCALQLAESMGTRIHVCHVPGPDDLLRIARARDRGVAVTCEVTPHHLFLSTDDLPHLGPYGEMKPPLLSPNEVQRFWELLDLVDIIASDHAPHTRAEKEGASPPPGVPGLETTLPLLLGAVDEGRLTLERAVALVCDRPLSVYGLERPAGARVEIAWGAHAYDLPHTGYHTRCGWSPFGGRKARGRVAAVYLRDECVWAEGRLLAAPGSGRGLRRSEAAFLRDKEAGHAQ
jgi:carbamoyl-phosphate synthase/aspartate carbamoyltransferase/dihydroorotase